MTASVRPTPIPRPDWRLVSVYLSADEQVALQKLAVQERRERSEMAALIIRLELERQGLILPPEGEITN
jgi:hypothetical protein